MLKASPPGWISLTMPHAHQFLMRWKQLEDAFVERRPHGESQNTFTLEPRSSNAIRAKLLEMAAKDERRKNSAIKLLA